jgi:hypothetical protein
MGNDVGEIKKGWGKQMDPLLMELGKQGIGYLLLAVLAIAYIRKDKALADAYQKRVEDNNRLATVIEATNAAARALEHTSSQRGHILETIGETTQAVAEAMRAQTISLEQGKAIADTNRSALVGLTAQVHQLQRAVEKLGDDQRAAEAAARARK